MWGAARAAGSRSSASGCVAGDVFCGLGGWTWALQLAGYSPRWGMDNHRSRLLLHAANHPGCATVLGDVQEHRRAAQQVSELGLAPLWATSPPCQGYVTMNPADPRRRLTVDSVKMFLAAEPRPSVLVLENVRRIFKPRPQPELKHAMELLEAAGYTCHCGLLVASWLGLPYMRERFFLIAVARGSGIECNLRQRLAAARASAARTAKPTLAEEWGDGCYAVAPHSRDRKGKDGLQRWVRTTAQCGLSLRKSMGRLPPRHRFREAELDDGPLRPEDLLQPRDLLHLSGIPENAYLPVEREETFQVTANLVVPIMGCFVLNCIKWPQELPIAGPAPPRAAPSTAAAEEAEDAGSSTPAPHTAASVGNANADKSLQPCARCGEWTPHALTLRRLAQSVGGVTHIVAESDYGTKFAIMNKADLLGLTTDTGDKALSPWKVKTTLRGRRLLVIATGWPPLRIARLIKLCMLLYSPEGRWTATLGDAALVYVADIGAVAEARRVAGVALGAEGLRVGARGHHYWTCAHGKVGTLVDAWCFDTRGTSSPEYASLTGMRRALRRQLSHTLSSGERIDNLRGAIDGAHSALPIFGVLPDCSSARCVSSADPYFDQEHEYAKEEPVCVAGVLDGAAAPGGLPARAPQQRGRGGAPVASPPYSAQQCDKAREKYPGACELDPYAFDQAHVEHCHLCAQEYEDRGSVPREHDHPRVRRRVLHSRHCYFGLLFVRMFFGFLWTCDGFAHGNHMEQPLDARWPEGPLEDTDERRGERVPFIHHESVFKDEAHRHAYTRGMKKWYGVPGMVIPFNNLPAGPIHPDWRPPWTIPQKVVLRPRDVHKAKFDPGGKAPKARCVCALNYNFNSYFRHTRFRYTGVEHFARQVEPGDYISLVDISSMYLRMPLCKRMLKYMVFKDAFKEGRGAWGVHSRLPFGAALSPFYASVVSAECADILRSRGRRAWQHLQKRRKRLSAKRFRGWCRKNAHEHAFARWGEKAKATCYVDDIGLAGSERECAAAVRELVALLARLGLPAIDKDGTWEPRQSAKFLGIWFNTVAPHPHVKGAFAVELRIDADYRTYLIAQVTAALAGKEQGGEEVDLPSLIGCLSWAATVMCGGAAYLCSLHEVKSLRKKRHRHARRAWHRGQARGPKEFAEAGALRAAEQEMVGDLNWWLGRLREPEWQGSRVLLPDAAAAVMVKSDASGLYGAGYHVLKEGAGDTHSGHWPWTAAQQREFGEDMVAKELQPVIVALRRHGAAWANRRVKFGLDNSGAVFSILAGRAKSKACRRLMREMGDLLAKYRIDVTAHWVPRELNVVADLLSRQIGYGEALRRAGVVDGMVAQTGDYEAAITAVAPLALGG